VTPEQLRAAYRRHVSNFETVSIRRYTGTGTNRPRFDWDVAARVTEYAAEELVGPITQGDRKLIVLHEDLVEAGFPFPVQNGANWKVVVRGKELQIKAVNDNTRRLSGELIAYEITAG
jgi:hypothetical protein